MVMPWPLHPLRPWSMTKAGRQCIWMSGETTSPLDRTNMPASHTEAVTGPVRYSTYCSPAAMALSGRSDSL